MEWGILVQRPENNSRVAVLVDRCLMLVDGRAILQTKSIEMDNLYLNQ